MKAWNTIDLIGQKFGKLIVLERDGKSNNGRAKWLCECECGNKKIITGFALRVGKTQSCGCLKYVAYNWSGFGEISGSFWGCQKKRAKEKCKDFNLTIEQAWNLFLNQSRKCAISGVDIGFSRDYYRKQGQTASLDRIDSSKGYILENVQWVHKDINLMKHSLNENKFLEWCKIIVEYNKENH